MLLPDVLTGTLEDCRRYMNEAYGCRSGQGKRWVAAATLAL